MAPQRSSADRVLRIGAANTVIGQIVVIVVFVGLAMQSRQRRGR